MHDYRPPALFFVTCEYTQGKSLKFILWMYVREKQNERGQCAAGCWVSSFTDCQRHICPPPPPSCWVWFSTSTPTQGTKNRLRTHTETGERRKTTASWDHLVPSHLVPSSGCILGRLWMGGVRHCCESIIAHIGLNGVDRLIWIIPLNTLLSLPLYCFQSLKCDLIRYASLQYASQVSGAPAFRPTSTHTHTWGSLINRI